MGKAARRADGDDPGGILGAEHGRAPSSCHRCNLPALLFAADDRDAHTLLHDGHLDVTLRQAIAWGSIRCSIGWPPGTRPTTGGSTAGSGRARISGKLVVLDDLHEVRVSLTLQDGKDRRP